MINELQKVKDALGKLSFILNKEQKRYCVLIFAMSLIAAIFETLGVSVIIPVIQAVVSADKLMQEPYMAPFILLFHLETSIEIIIFLCIGVGVVYIIKNAYSVFYAWAAAKFSNKIRRELAVKVLDTYMKQGYIFFVNNNSSKLIRGISSDVNSVQNVVTNIFSFMCKFLTILGMTIFIIIQSPGMALWIAFLLVFCFIISQIVFRKPMRHYGQSAREHSLGASKASLEAVQGSKEVLVFGRQEYFVNEYLKNMIKYNKADVQMTVGTVAPSYLIEVVCIIGLLVAIAVQIVVVDNSGNLLAQISTIAVAAVRILPSLGVMLGNVNSIVFNAPGLTSAYETISLIKKLGVELDNNNESKKTEHKKTNFEKELVLANVSYAYPETKKNVIDNLTMTITKGASIGLIGASGAGKTTLADIILNLLKPQSGKILLDGIDIEELGNSWNYIIGYVPQSIYMVDASIRRNVAFGIEETLIDDDKIWNALEMAQMKEFVQNLPQKLDTKVGEWGVQLSGGQRQRIAIARALYNDPDIIVLDEATAALDTETENAVMESIEALQKVKTLIIVAHRLTTVKKCDEIYEVIDGKAISKTKEEIFNL